jgi:hypothetical protein
MQDFMLISNLLMPAFKDAPKSKKNHEKNVKKR